MKTYEKEKKKKKSAHIFHLHASAGCFVDIQETYFNYYFQFEFLKSCHTGSLFAKINEVQKKAATYAGLVYDVNDARAQNVSTHCPVFVNFTHRQTGRQFW